MSSSIIVNRICEYCGNPFVARTTVTRYCSLTCNRKDYKEKLRNKKIENSHLQTQYVRRDRVETTDGEVFSIAQAASFLEKISRQTIRDLIKSGRLNATRITPRNIRILKTDLLLLFDNNMGEVANPLLLGKANTGNENDAPKAIVDKLYGIGELTDKFNKSRDAIYAYLKRNRIRGIKNGKSVLYRAADIDKLYERFINPGLSQHDKDRKFNEKLSKKILRIEDCYSMEECELKFNKKRSLLYGIFSRRFVPTLQDGHFKYYYKAAVDRIYKNGNVVQKDRRGGKDERC